MWSRSSVQARTSAVAPSAVQRAVRPPESGAPSSFIGRVAETEAILRAVRHPIAAGAVVVGPPGSGKTALLHHVQRSLADSYIVRVRGLASAASFPFRALSFLLSEVPSASMHPALVVNAVAKYLREEAGGRRIVLAIDNAEHLDESSSTLIGQLIAGRVASVVLTATDFSKADASFMALWRASSLRRIDLEPLSLEETRHFVAARLAAPASREVVDAAWTVGGGNPQAVRAALEAYTQRGLIARRGTSWVLLPGRPGTSQDIVAHFPLLQSLTPGQRTVVDLLALAGPLGWTDLAEGTEPTDIDALQDAGLLVIESLAAPQASLATPGLAVAVAEVVGRQEASHLLERIERTPDAHQRLHEDPARLAFWALRAGRSIDEDLAVAAASALNDDGDHEEAVHLIDTVGMGTSTRLAYQALVAALGLGQRTEASAAAAVLTRAEERLDDRDWVLFKIAESRLRRLGTRTAGPVVNAVSGASDDGPGAGSAAVGGAYDEPLEQAEQRLQDQRSAAETVGDTNRVVELASLGRLLTVARAELASFEGRFTDVLALIDGAESADFRESTGGAVIPGGAGTAEDAEVRVALESLAHEANIVMNRQSRAESLATLLAKHLAHPDLAPRHVDAALVRAGLAHLASGRTSEGSWALATFADSPDPTRWSVQRGSLTALADALLLVRQDAAGDAAELLVPAVEQLRIADPRGVLPIAVSLLSFCHALAEPLEQSVSRLPALDTGDGGSWLVRRVAQHFRLLTEARQGKRTEAADALRGLASTDLQHGLDAPALMSLGAAVRFGCQDAVPDLASLAARTEGTLAAVFALYADALATSDVDRLTAAMDAAAATGNLRLVADIAQSGINATTRNQDKASLRAIQRQLRQLIPEAVPTEAASHLDLLTSREREVAVLAASGRSNRAIALQMFVSVRTVEGHLYQVYSKLNVSTRAELAELIPSEGVR